MRLNQRFIIGPYLNTCGRVNGGGVRVSDLWPLVVRVTYLRMNDFGDMRNICILCSHYDKTLVLWDEIASLSEVPFLVRFRYNSSLDPQHFRSLSMWVPNDTNFWMTRGHHVSHADDAYNWVATTSVIPSREDVGAARAHLTEHLEVL